MREEPEPSRRLFHVVQKLHSPTAKTLMPWLFSFAAGPSASSWDLPSVMRMQIYGARKKL